MDQTQWTIVANFNSLRQTDNKELHVVPPVNNHLSHKIKGRATRKKHHLDTTISNCNFIFVSEMHK